LKDKSALRNHLLVHVPDTLFVRMKKGIFRECGTKETFSCVCCRGHFTILWKSEKNTFLGPQSVYSWSLADHEVFEGNTFYAPVKTVRGDS
jgi:hypothetical protein